jgi:hypothetical protein
VTPVQPLAEAPAVAVPAPVQTEQPPVVEPADPNALVPAQTAEPLPAVVPAEASQVVVNEPAPQEVLPSEKPFVTLDDAREQLNALIERAPNGGSRFGLITWYSSQLMISQEQTGGGWRIGVSIGLPRSATALGGLLASWGVPFSRKRVEFVVKAVPDAVLLGAEGGPRQKAHSYTLLNGSFQLKHHLSTEIQRARPFRDAKLRMWYDSAYDCTDFADVLKAINSELTGESAF